MTTASNPYVSCSIGVNGSRGHKTRREPWWGKWVHRSDVERGVLGMAGYKIEEEGGWRTARRRANKNNVSRT